MRCAGMTERCSLSSKVKLTASYLKDVKLQIQLWFTYGALASHTDTPGVPRNFEDRVREYWKPAVARKGLNTHPDFIIWASGTWDVLGLRKKYADRQRPWREQAISWQELAWHRKRLNEMAECVYLNATTYLVLLILLIMLVSFERNGPIYRRCIDLQPMSTRRTYPRLITSWPI